MDKKTLELLDYYKVLDFLSSFALSEEGKQKCKKLLPLEKLKDIKENFLLLKEALKFKDVLLKEVKPFLNLSNVFEFVIKGKSLDEDGLWAIKDFMSKAFSCKKAILKNLPEESVLKTKAKTLSWPQKSWQALNRCMGKDGEIKSDSTPELFEIRKEISAIQSQCTKKITRFIDEEKIDFLQDEYFTVSSDRYVLALKSNFKGKLEGIIHDYSRSGETCYFEPLFLVELNNKLQKLRQKEKEEVKKVLEYLTSLIREEIKEVKDVYNWMVDLDVLRAKVLMMLEFKGSVVEIKEHKPLSLLNAKNPILLINKSKVHPVDLILKSEQKGLLISGGNAGGKTVALKTLGLITLMTLSALPVPADKNSSIPLWKKVFVILGDEQDISKHLSTFTAQVSYIKEIWNRLDSNTLVILDEFGSGTDPTEGSALAQALIEELLNKDVYVAVATHFPSLKAFALSNERIRSAAVLFDPVTQKPLFKIGYDQVGASLALEIAKEYGLPQEILNRAKSYLFKEKRNLDEVFEKINLLTVQREREIHNLEKEKTRLEEEKKRLKEKYEKRIAQVLEDIRNFIRELREEIKKEKIKQKFALKEAQKKYREILNRLSSETNEDSTSSFEWDKIKLGLKVFYVPWQKEGIVEEKDHKDKRIRIKIGNVRIWCDLEELLPCKTNSNKEDKFIERLNKNEFLGWRLDIRGLRVDEAISRVSKFLDSALYKGKSEVEIIHGRGEGVLKKAVHEYLKEFSNLFSYSYAPEDRGGDGVTLVRIKDEV